MAVRRLNHAVLYVRDLAASVDFYTDALGFEVRTEIPGRAAFLRAQGTANDHDLGLFSVPAGRLPDGQYIGLYHLAWEVGTLAELAEARDRLAARGALVGASDHRVSKSLYAKDPNGIEFEVMWRVPAEAWEQEMSSGDMIAPLDLDAELARWGDLVTGAAARLGDLTVAADGVAGERIEVDRTIPAPAAAIFAVLRDPQGHVAIDSSGMLMSADGDPVGTVGDSFVVHMDREALHDHPLGRYDVTVSIVRYVQDTEIAWTVLSAFNIGHVYGYRLEPADGGTLVTSYYDWSQISQEWRDAGIFPVISEAALRATLGILERAVLRGYPAGPLPGLQPA